MIFRISNQRLALAADGAGVDNAWEQKNIWVEKTACRSRRIPSVRWDERGFLMDAEGRFYVQDRGNSRIAVFDTNGRYERSIGRAGQGPGEFTFLHLTGIYGDLLETYDEARQRFTLFRTDGTLVGTLASPVGGGRIFLDHADSTLVARSYPQAEREGITWVGAGFRTFTRSGEAVGQAQTPLIEMYYAYDWAGHKGGVGGEDMPFTSYPSMAWAPPRGVFLIDGKTPVVWHFGTDGALLKKIGLDFPDRPVTADDRRRFTLDLMRRVEESAGDEHDVLQATLSTLTFPDRKSHWSSITVDDRGYVWLEVAVWPGDAGSSEGTGCTYQVLSPAGEFLGSTRAPAAGRILRGHLLAVLTDPETGREDHIVWRLVPMADGFNYPGG